MKTIILIACVATKSPTPQRGEDMYISPLFKKTITYAKSLNPDDIFILSAKHLLLPLDKVISPYNMTLNDMDADQKKDWSERILRAIKNHGFNTQRDKFIFLAGVSYRKYLEPSLKYHSAPLEGLRIGEQMHWLDNKIKKIKESLVRIKQIIYETIRKINK